VHIDLPYLRGAPMSDVDAESYLADRYPDASVYPEGSDPPRSYEVQTGYFPKRSLSMNFVHQTPMEGDSEGWCVVYTMPGEDDGTAIGGCSPESFDELSVACDIAEEIISDRLRGEIKDRQKALDVLNIDD